MSEGSVRSLLGRREGEGGGREGRGGEGGEGEVRAVVVRQGCPLEEEEEGRRGAGDHCS